MTKAVIVGIDMIPFKRYPERTLEDLGAEAALLALADAGLSVLDVQALYCGSALQAIAFPGQRSAPNWRARNTRPQCCKWMRNRGFGFPRGGPRSRNWPARCRARRWR